MALLTMTPTGAASLAVTPTSARVAIPAAGTPTTLIAANLGTAPIFILMGNSSVVVTTATGLLLMPGQVSVPLAIGANTNIAAITASGNSSLHIDVGT